MIPSSSQPFVSTLSGIAELTNLGVIRATGEDAVKFLQGQLTQDVASMDLTRARLAAFCNAKGRMQASFIVFKRSQDDVLLVCSRDILAATLKRLSMFMMRAKAKLSDASGEFVLYGVVGSTIETIAANARPAWGKSDIDDGNMVFLPSAAGQTRALWCVPTGTPVPADPLLALETWQWLEVQSGIAMITQPIFEAFVPQMLNYESVGGVNFKKGCYPGQEIVARSQFRGTLKRRAYLAHTLAAPFVGQDVFQALDTEQPCGVVAAAAPHPLGGFDVVISIQTSAADPLAQVLLTLGNATGAALTLQPLPYQLLEDI